MASRTHIVDNGNTRITASAGRVWLYFYQEWNASMRREERIRETIWWNPFSWFTREYWKSAGWPPGFNVRFLNGAGQDITELLNPTRQPPRDRAVINGYIKVSTVYASVGFSSSSSRPGTANIDALGNDARSVTGVTMEYTIDGEPYTLSAT